MNAEQENIYYSRASQIVNILKGLAIWMVVTYHFFQSITVNAYLELLADCMQLGCQIFFTLSCFTLCLSYSKKKPSYLQYVKHRILKLFLAFYVMIIFGVIWRVSFALKSGSSVMEAINFPGLIVNALFLNGLVPDYIIHNFIVRGGWFIGTLFILYLIFPILYKVFNLNNEKWKKHKIYLFPTLIILTSLIILALLYLVFGFGNYFFFVYTSFINQICAFVFGFVIFHLYQTVKIKQIKFPFLKALLCAALSIVIFIKFPLARIVVVMTLIGLATLYAFTFLFNNAFIKDNLESEIVLQFLAKSGKISLGIYYTHSYLVWEFTQKVTQLIFKIDNNPHILVKAMVGIIVFVLCYWVGKIFNVLVNLANDYLIPLINKFLEKHFKVFREEANAQQQ